MYHRYSPTEISLQVVHLIKVPNVMALSLHRGNMDSRIRDIPRKLCSSSCGLDYFWTSHVVLLSNWTSSSHLYERRLQATWSPGLVVVIPPGRLAPDAIKGLVHLFKSISTVYGKARRITCGTPIGKDIAALLYGCFYCVEFINTNGETIIIDDGREAVVQAERVRF